MLPFAHNDSVMGGPKVCFSVTIGLLGWALIPKKTRFQRARCVLFTQVGILFVRCKAGISHSPEEAVEPDDIWAASLALMLFLQEETLK